MVLERRAKSLWCCKSGQPHVEQDRCTSGANAQDSFFNVILSTSFYIIDYLLYPSVGRMKRAGKSNPKSMWTEPGPTLPQCPTTSIPVSGCIPTRPHSQTALDPSSQEEKEKVPQPTEYSTHTELFYFHHPTEAYLITCRCVSTLTTPFHGLRVGGKGILLRCTPGNRN